MSLPLHVVFDGRYIRTTHHDGISRFSANLAAELAKLVAPRDDLRLTVLICDEAQRQRIPYLGDLTTFSVNAPTSIREPFVAHAVNRISPDVVFSPMQTMGSRGRHYRLVLTIHDLIYYRHPTPPREFNVAVRALWRLYHLSWWPQRMLLRGADAVVAVSNTTRDLIARYRLTRKPVYVVPNAADALGEGAIVPFTQRPRRLVYMGSFMPYKNVETLVRASELLPDFELHLMSRISEADRLRLTALSPHGRVVFHNGCSDEAYGEALRNATALVTASKEEGFGIPLVEAMSIGTPVIVSDIPIFREIGGAAAIYADPDSPESFAAAVRQLVDTSTWQERSVASRTQAGHYSWGASAAALLNVLVEVAHS